MGGQLIKGRVPLEEGPASRPFSGMMAPMTVALYISTALSVRVMHIAIELVLPALAREIF